MDFVNAVGSTDGSVNGLPPLSLSRAFSNATQRSWSEQMSQNVEAQPSVPPPLSLMGARGNARAVFPPAAASATMAMQETQDMF